MMLLQGSHGTQQGTADPVLGDVRVVLVAPKTAANVGAAARCCANFEVRCSRARMPHRAYRARMPYRAYRARMPYRVRCHAGQECLTGMLVCLARIA